MAIQTGQSTYTPKSHDSTFHTGATANILTGLTPVFANWTQNPGTAANIIDEVSNAVLTTNGIGAAGSNTIKYDLGTSRRRLVRVRSEELFTVYISDSDASYQVLSNNNPAASIFDSTGLGKFQWLKLEWLGVLTVSEIKARVYNIN